MLYSQQDAKKNEYKVLIDTAISVFADYKYKHLGEDYSGETYYVVDEHSKQIFITNIDTNLSLKTIDIKDKKNIKLIKKGIRVFQVSSVLNGNEISVSIINFIVRYKGKTYYYINNGGATILFQYSCDNEKWILAKVEYNTI